MDLTTNTPHQGYGEDEVGQLTDTTFTNFEEFEAYKATVVGVIEQAKAAMRLAENPDFQKIIMTAYLEQEPARLASLMASGKLNAKSFDECAEDLRGIGNLAAFLSQYAQKGVIANQELEDLEEARRAAIEDGA